MDKADEDKRSAELAVEDEILSEMKAQLDSEARDHGTDQLNG